MNMKISTHFSILLWLWSTTINLSIIELQCFFSVRWQGVNDERRTFSGTFPLRSDGFISKCYVNVITNTEKVLSRSLRSRYSLSGAMKPFASEAHRLWQGELTSFLSCQKQFLEGLSVPLSPVVCFCSPVLPVLSDNALWPHNTSNISVNLLLSALFSLCYCDYFALYFCPLPSCSLCFRLYYFF